MKILVVTKDMYLGGVQKACVNFVNYLVANGLNVDLLIFNPNGPLAKDISKDVNLLNIDKSILPFAVSQRDSRNYGFGFFLKRTINACVCRVFGNKRPLERALKKQKELTELYDVAISFQPSMGKKSLIVGCAEYVLSKVKAKTKWIFSHGDYEKSGLNEPYANYIFGQFDRVFCVSKSCAELMKKANVTLANKIDYVYNICDAEDIKKKAEEPIEEKISDKFELITVARLSEEKGHARLLEQLKKLHDDGCDFQYTIVGDGKERQNIEDIIHKYDMSSYVKLMGNKSNPYPYIKRADLFVLPSHHESYGLVLIESMILGVPVLTTKTSAAEEVVLDNGFICGNDDESLYKSLKQLLSDKKGIGQMKSALAGYRYKVDERLINLLQSANIDKQ